MDNGLLKFLLRANLVVGLAFLIFTGLFTFGRVSEMSAVATGYDWRGGLCLVQSAIDSLSSSRPRSCWDLLADSTLSRARFVDSTLILLAQFCGVAAAALLLNAFTVRRMLKKK
jgi:hypothetical protein